MEIVLFISFIAVCAVVLMLASGKSRKDGNAAQKRKAIARKTRQDLLATPSEYTLSKAEKVWHTRRNSANVGVSRTNAFVARSLGQDPEYDGYSRRDRHHVRDRNAHIKTEAHTEEPQMTSIEYKESKAAG